MWSRAEPSFKLFRWPCIWSYQETNQRIVGRGSDKHMTTWVSTMHCTTLFYHMHKKPHNSKCVQYSTVIILKQHLDFSAIAPVCPCALHPPGWREGSSTLHSSAHFHRSNPTPVRKKTCQNASFIKFPFIMGRCAIYCGPLWKMLGSNDTVRWGCLRHLSGKKKC